MAGSDLDGDEYFVCWMDELIFSRDNYPPMEFPASKTEELNRPVTVEDMVQYLKFSILNEKLGILTNLHVRHADCQPDGIYSKVCKFFFHKKPTALHLAN